MQSYRILFSYKNLCAKKGDLRNLNNGLQVRYEALRLQIYVYRTGMVANFNFFFYICGPTTIYEIFFLCLLYQCINH